MSEESQAERARRAYQEETQRAREAVQETPLEDIPEEEWEGRAQRGLLPSITPVKEQPIATYLPGGLPKDAVFVPNKNIPSQVSRVEPVVQGGRMVCIEREGIMTYKEYEPTKITAELKHGEKPEATTFTRRVGHTIGSELRVWEQCKIFNKGTVDCVNQKRGAADVCKVVEQAHKCSLVNDDGNITGPLAGGLVGADATVGRDCTERLASEGVVRETVPDKGRRNFMGDPFYTVQR